MGDRTPRRAYHGTASAATTPVGRIPMSVGPPVSCPVSPDTASRNHPSMMGPPCGTVEDSARIRVVAKMRHIDGEAEPMKGLTLAPKGKAVELTISDTWPEKVYGLDAFYTAQQSPSEVFATEVEPIISRVVAGFNATVFAHGATGSGKTFLMQGNGRDGLIQKTASWLLSGKHDIRAKMAYYELYCDKVVDLNTGALLTILETADGTDCIKGLTQMPLSSYPDFEEAFGAAAERRKTGSTNINATSSRSHAILEISCWDSDFKYQLGKIRLLDLAGSENNSETGNRNLRLQESCWINESLFFLGRVIDEIADGQKTQMRLQRLQDQNGGAEGASLAPRTQVKSGRRSSIGYIGYRSSKLTRVLKDTIGGESQAVMIACLKPNNLSNTLRILDLAARSRQIQKPREEAERHKQTAASQREAHQSIAEQLEAWKAQRAAASPRVGAPSFICSATPRALVSPALDARGGRNAPMSLPRPPRPSPFQPRTCLQSQADPAFNRSEHAPVRKLAFGHVAPGMAHKPGEKAPPSAHKWQNLGTGVSPSWVRGMPAMRGEPLSTIVSPPEGSTAPPATEGRATRSGHLSMGVPQSVQHTRSGRLSIAAPQSMQRTRPGRRQSLAVPRMPPIAAVPSPEPVPFEVEYSAPSDSDSLGDSVARNLGASGGFDGPAVDLLLGPEEEADATVQAHGAAVAEAEAGVLTMDGAEEAAETVIQENVAGSPVFYGASVPGLSLVTPAKGQAADSLLALGALGANGASSSAAPPSAAMRRSPRTAVPLTPNLHMASSILASLGLEAHTEAGSGTSLDQKALPTHAGSPPLCSQLPESSPLQQEASHAPRSPVQSSPFQVGASRAQCSGRGIAASPAPSPDTYWLTGPSNWAQQTNAAAETETASLAAVSAGTAEGAESAGAAEGAGPGAAFEFPVGEAGFSFPLQSPTRASPKESATPMSGLASLFSPSVAPSPAGATSPTVSIRRTLEGMSSARAQDPRRSTPRGASPSPRERSPSPSPRGLKERSPSPSPRGLKERSPSQINKVQNPSVSPNGKRESQENHILSPAASLLAVAPQDLLPSGPTILFHALTAASPSGPSPSPIRHSPSATSPKAPTPPAASSRTTGASPQLPMPTPSHAHASVPEGSPRPATPTRPSTPGAASLKVPTPAASPAQAAAPEGSARAPADSPAVSPRAHAPSASPQAASAPASPLPLVPAASSPAPGPAASPAASLAAAPPQGPTAVSSPLSLLPPASPQALASASTPLGAGPVSRRPGETPVTRQKKVFKDVIAEEILAKLNEAPEEELIASFKGVGPVYAKKIIAERANAKNGEVAFKTVLDLNKIGMAQKRIETLKTAYYTSTINKKDDDE